jgi:hypothetical protein
MSTDYAKIIAEYTLEPGRASPGEGAEVLNRIVTFIRRFVSVSDSQAIVLTLWVAHTHVFVAAECTPYMAITSAEKQCGKTRLLEVLDVLVANSWLTGQVTAAVLARKIGDDVPPTLLLDESDAAFAGEKEYVEALRGILNSGYRKGGKYSRCVGQGTKMQVRDFSSFCPKAIAGIGKLPDTIADRSIPIRLKRAARGEGVARFRRREVLPEAEQLRNDQLIWCTSLDSILEYVRPELPDELSDRKQDVAEPLLAIADAAGGDWRDKARRALIELCAEARALEDSIGVQLLGDIRNILVDRGIDRIPSCELATALAEIETSPWAEYSKGKPISKNKVAYILNRYEIKSGTIRLHGDRTAKGYYKDDFADAWSRYLSPADPPPPPSSPTSKRHNVTTRTNIDDSVDFGNVTPPACDVNENSEIPNKNEPCDDVTFSEQGEGQTGYEKDPSGPGCTCQECGLHFGSVPGWQAHRGRCERVEAAD